MALDVSLAVLGSVTLPVTVAVLLMVVPTGAFDTFTTTLIEAPPELAMVPRLQVTVVAPVQVPCVDLALTNVVPLGKVSVTVTQAAWFGPLFATVMA